MDLLLLIGGPFDGQKVEVQPDAGGVQLFDEIGETRIEYTYKRKRILSADVLICDGMDLEEASGHLLTFYNPSDSVSRADVLSIAHAINKMAGMAFARAAESVAKNDDKTGMVQATVGGVTGIIAESILTVLGGADDD